jgi:hypothetical protein
MKLWEKCETSSHSHRSLSYIGTKKEAALLRGPSSGSFEIRRSAVQGDDLAIQNSITREGAVFGV